MSLITTVLIPIDNEKDLVEIPDNIKGNLKIKPVKWIDEVLEIALAARPVPLAATPESVAADPKQAAGRRAGRRAGKGGVQAH